MYTIVACVYLHVYEHVYGMCVCICIAYTVWRCVDMPLAADINITMRVACISLGASFRDQTSRTTRDLSRIYGAKVSLFYTFTLLFYTRLYACDSICIQVYKKMYISFS